MNKIDGLCLIDDDDMFQYLAKRTILETELVNRIMIFPDGLAAINFLKAAQHNPEELPEMILLDLNMPVMDGWEFLTEYIALLPKLKKKIALYILSSSIDPSDIQKAQSISEVKDFVIKPITKDKFRELIKQYTNT